MGLWSGLKIIFPLISQINNDDGIPLNADEINNFFVKISCPSADDKFSNSFPPKVVIYSKVTMFADDTTLKIRGKPSCIALLISMMEEDLRRVSERLYQTRLCTNDDKVFLMVAGPAHILSKLPAKLFCESRWN